MSENVFYLRAGGAGVSVFARRQRTRFGLDGLWMAGGPGVAVWRHGTRWVAFKSCSCACLEPLPSMLVCSGSYKKNTIDGERAPIANIDVLSSRGWEVQGQDASIVVLLGKTLGGL